MLSCYRFSLYLFYFHYSSIFFLLPFPLYTFHFQYYHAFLLSFFTLPVLLSLFSRFFPTTVSTLHVSLSVLSCFHAIVFHFTRFTHYYHAFMLSFSTLRVSLIIMFYFLLSRLMLLFSTLQVSITTTDFPVTMSIEH